MNKEAEYFVVKPEEKVRSSCTGLIETIGSILPT